MTENEHTPSIGEENRCVASTSQHRCDLVDFHTSRHMCACGQYFGPEGEGGIPAVAAEPTSVAVTPPVGGLAPSLSLPGRSTEPPGPTPKLIIPGRDTASDGPLCGRCGQSMPPLPDELKALARQAGGVTLTHDVCPGTEPETPAGRYYEVQCRIVHVPDPTPRDHDLTEIDQPEARELASFHYGTRAVDLEAAMRPLAVGLGERWMRIEKQARIAEAPDGPAEGL